MNLCILTGKIVNKSMLNLVNNQPCVHTTLMIPNNKRGLNFYKILVIANGRIADDIIDLYQVGDSVIIESSVLLKKGRNKLNGKIYKCLIFQVHDIHPTNNILNNFV